MVDVESNMKLVGYVYNKYFKKKHFRYKEDLLQEGYVGLVEASKLFNEKIGMSFKRYATCRIKITMGKFLLEESKFSMYCH